MNEDLAKIIEGYKQKHPEFDDILQKFHFCQETYEKAMRAIAGRSKEAFFTCNLTTQGRYNVNVSATH